MGGAIHLSPVLQSENEIGSKPTSRNAVLPVSDHAGRVDFNGCFLKVLRNFCHKIDQITFCKSHLHSGKILAKSFYYVNYSMFPIKRTVFFTTVTLLKNTVRLMGNIEYGLSISVSKVSQIISETPLFILSLLRLFDELLT